MTQISSKIKNLLASSQPQRVVRRLFTAMSCVLMLVCVQTTFACAASREGTGLINRVVSDLLDVTLQTESQMIQTQVRDGATVAELLNLEGVSYDEYDTISPSLSSRLEDGDEIVIEHTEDSDGTVREVVLYESTEDKSAQLPDGFNEVEDSIVEDSIVEDDGDDNEEKTLQNPLEAIVSRTGKTPISPLDFGVETDSDGRPVQFQDLLLNQESTAYYAQPGALTASGMKAGLGYVAVNPNRIPYGTKLYIEAADGSFVYGYAIAADTGSALMRGSADVDLFYETRAECIVHGRQSVNVYILE